MNSNYSSQKGVMLLEALIGLLIFSLGILSLVAMQSTAVSQMRDSKYRTEASMLSDKLLTTMTIEGSGSTSSTAVTVVKNEVAAVLPNGLATITTGATSFGANVLSVNIEVSWRAPAATAPSKHVTAGLLNYNN